jgi:hypothetical protein
MICRKQPAFLKNKPLKITNLLEIRLAASQWWRIVELSRRRRRTYSTITRYCVLRLARKCSLRWTPRMQKARARAKEELKSIPAQHRHMLCLYGEDEKLIRLAALELGLTLTTFVRLALALYLENLAMEKRSHRFVTGERLKWEAIRFIEKIHIFATDREGYPLLRDLTCIGFALASYW